MRLLDEEIQASGKRRNQKECRNCTDRDSVNWTGCPGRICQCQPISPGRDDRERGNSCATVITAITGGILEQLILEAKEDLANSEARVDQLHSRVQLLASLKASLDGQK